MLGDPDVPPSPSHPPSSSSAPAEDQARAPFLRCRALPAQPRKVFGQGIRERSGCPILLAHRPVPRTAVCSPRGFGELLVSARGRGPCVGLSAFGSKPTQNHRSRLTPQTGGVMLRALPLRPRAPRGALVPPACPAGTSATQVGAVKVRGSAVPQDTQLSRGAFEAEVLPGSRGSAVGQQPACLVTQRAQHGGGCRARPLFVGQCHRDAVPGAGRQDPGGVSTGLLGSAPEPAAASL